METTRLQDSLITCLYFLLKSSIISLGDGSLNQMESKQVKMSKLIFMVHCLVKELAFFFSREEEEMNSTKLCVTLFSVFVNGCIKLHERF